VLGSEVQPIRLSYRSTVLGVRLHVHKCHHGCLRLQQEKHSRKSDDRHKLLMNTRTGHKKGVKGGGNVISNLSRKVTGEFGWGARAGATAAGQKQKDSERRVYSHAHADRNEVDGISGCSRPAF
jgi:hypothetical protein